MDHRLDFADGWRPAGVSWRLAATLLDMAMYCGLCALLAIPVSQKFNWSAAWGGIDHLARATSDPLWLAHASGILGLWLALWWCYFIVGWGLLGATPGKWAVGLRITDYRQRYPIGPTRALLRLAAYCVSSMTFEWGHLLMLIRSDKRTLHDILAGTRVVRKSAPPVAVEPGSASESESESESDVEHDIDSDPDSDSDLHLKRQRRFPRIHGLATAPDSSPSAAATALEPQRRKERKDTQKPFLALFASLRFQRCVGQTLQARNSVLSHISAGRRQRRKP